jgi:uncharacterized BrkB/YihY/UPF0761 family membrane protein
VAFFALLSLAPFLSLVVAAALGSGGSLAAELLPVSRQLLPREAHAVIQEQVRKIQSSAEAGVLSLSFVILLWSSSSSFIAVMDAINAAYGSRDQRPWWRRRLMAVVLTVVESVLLIVALVAILAWPPEASSKESIQHVAKVSGAARICQRHDPIQRPHFFTRSSIPIVVKGCRCEIQYSNSLGIPQLVALLATALAK